MTFTGAEIRKAMNGKKCVIALTRHVSGAPSRKVHIDMQVVMFTRFLRRMASLAFVLNSNLMLKPLPMWTLNLNVF